jgi:glycine C-acetyltransferase
MSLNDPLEHSLEDFSAEKGESVVEPPEAFTEWHQTPEVQFARSLFEQPMQSAPENRTVIEDKRLGGSQSVINVSSYNYLGLSRHPEVLESAFDAAESYGLSASGAQMLSGTFDLHEEFADKIAGFKGYGDCMLFSSGLNGNIGAMQALMGDDDVVFMDRRCHQSLLDGVELAGARQVSFGHNDVDELDHLLNKYDGRRRLVVIEGVYSMDGDTAELPSIVEVCDKHDVPIYLDEAHSTLVFGGTGQGVAEYYGLEDDIDISFGTLSKAFGGVGGFICADEELVDYLKFYCSPFVFSCALPPPIVAGMKTSLDVATRDPKLRAKLWNNVEYFRENLEALNLDLGESESQILPIIIGDSREMLYMMAGEAQKRGLYLQPVDYPAVPADSRRFRVAVSAQLTEEDIDEASNIIEDVVAKPLGVV